MFHLSVQDGFNIVSRYSSTIENESPEYYSFDGTQLDTSDEIIIQSTELQRVSSPLDPVEENDSKAGCQDPMVYGNEYTVDDDEASLSFEDQSNNFCSIMEDDKTILACHASEDVKAHNNGVHLDPVTTKSEALEASSESFKPDQAVIKKNTAEKSTSPELAQCMSAFTQTEDPGTSDKHVITEVHMADLDYLAEVRLKPKSNHYSSPRKTLHNLFLTFQEFIRLKMAKEELREQKEKIKR